MTGLVIKRRYTKKRIIEILFLIGVLLLVVIPKGGFKIAGIPITWGYLYLGSLFLGVTRFILKREQLVINNKHYISFLATLPFVVYFTVHLFFNGYEGTFGNVAAFYISFLFLPFLFYIYLGGFLKTINQDYILRLISKAILIVSLYGILLFFIKFLFKIDLEIPYITINVADLGMATSKFNGRGDLSKLISTYNNGNIFGVSILMLFPVFYSYEKSKIKLAIVIIALILTLSRTVWLGLVFFIILKYHKRFFMLLKVGMSVGLVFLVFSLLLLSKNFQYGSLGGFILDAKFGGRLKQINEAFSSISLFGDVYEAITEIVYLSILKQFGIVGLILFMLSFFTPVIVFFFTKNNNYNYFLGVLIYLFICFSDGCMLLIPTLCFFYFICTMALTDKKRIE
jgi:hypothetical protein